MAGLLVLIVLGALLVLKGLGPGGQPPPSKRLACLRGFQQLGGLLVIARVEKRLEYVTGAAFLLQVRGELTDEQLRVFRCPGDPSDPASTPCSYRGPDEWLLNELREGRRPGIIACDANGPDGDEPFHEDGVCVLYDNASVNIIPWAEMEGYEGGPVRVGPHSPDPRSRHLIR